MSVVNCFQNGIFLKGNTTLQDLADAIKSDFYSRGRQKEIAESNLKLDPNGRITWGSVDRLVKQYNDTVEKKSE